MAASTAEHGTGESEENFQQFLEKWKQKQNQHLQELMTASEQLSCSPPPPPNSSVSDRTRLVQTVIELYEEYYRTKSKWTDKNVLLMLSPSWTSSPEDAFRWVGGWRPTMAVQLLYSKSGLQLEAKLGDLIQGILTKHDLADLSSSQLRRVDELHRRIIREENDISGKMATQQEKATDPNIVELSHLVTRAMREEEKGGSRRDREDEREQIRTTLSPKVEGFRKILQKADDLRLRTLKNIIDILSPVQAIHFLIATAELQLRLHDWGMAEEGRQLDVGVNDSVSPQDGVRDSICPSEN